MEPKPDDIGDSSDGSGESSTAATDESTSEESSTGTTFVDDESSDVESTGEPAPSCRNGILEPGEECDTNPTIACTDLGYFAGDLRCNNDCEIDPVGCHMCGNGVVDPGEECDGDVFAGDCECTPQCRRIGDACRPQSLVVTEMFRASPADATQWLELYTHDTRDRVLTGCKVHDLDGRYGFEIDGDVRISAQGYAVLAAASSQPLGFTPAFVMPPGFELPLAFGSVVVECDGTALDTVWYFGASPWPTPEANSSIQARHLDDGINDNGLDWCTAVTPYADDARGTPNAPTECG